ncbi:MAG: hypothetical protein DRO88_02090 [Promethearchaeia archaeon]|nr:MAG: hypothetical protein DRO88_02090 [Candidatus Lokiarchaeia archaeon]
MVHHNLSEFESIGEKYAHILYSTMKIKTVDDFERYSIEDIHNRTDIDLERIKQWKDLIDLFRVPNLGARECELLYFANINSVEELSHRQSLRIFYKLREIDEETRFIVLTFPSFAQIDDWIFFAKHMNKRIKYGLNVPLILFPMVNLDVASEFKKFNIFTVEHLLEKVDQINHLHRKVHLRKKDYKMFLEMINFIRIPGIDIKITNLLFQAGIDSLEKFKKLSPDEILSQINQISEIPANLRKELTSETIKEFQKYQEGE